MLQVLLDIHTMFDIGDELKKSWRNGFFNKSLLEFVVKFCLFMFTYDIGSLR